MSKILILFLAFWTLLNFTESKQQKHLKLLHKVCDLNAFCYDDEKPFVLVKEDDKACPEPNDQLPRSRSKNRNLNEESEEDFDAEEMEFKKVSQFLGNCTEVRITVVENYRNSRVQHCEQFFRVSWRSVSDVTEDLGLKHRKNVLLT